MQFTTLSLAILPALSLALPTGLERRQATGSATWYNTYYPTYSSCGDQPQDTDMIAALAPSFMPAACGKKIAVTNTATGAVVQVTVVDTCEACGAGAVAVDLTPTAFGAANGGDTSAGTFAATWAFA